MEDRRRITFGGLLKIVLLLAILIGAIVFLVDYKLENIEIRSGNFYTEQEIKDLLFVRKSDAYTYLFAFRVNNFEKPKLTFVEKIDVEVTDRNSVIVYVYDKAITGCFCHMGTYFYFDREGMIADSAAEHAKGIPEIKGVTPKEYTIGRKLDVGNADLFTTVLDILMCLNKNGLEAEDITFSVRDEITLHIDGNEILLGNTGNNDFKCNNIKNVMAAAGGNLEDVRYRFDFRNYSETNMEVYATVLK